MEKAIRDKMNRAITIEGGKTAIEDYKTYTFKEWIKGMWFEEEGSLYPDILRFVVFYKDDFIGYMFQKNTTRVFKEYDLDCANALIGDTVILQKFENDSWTEFEDEAVNILEQLSDYSLESLN